MTQTEGSNVLSSFMRGVSPGQSAYLQRKAAARAAAKIDWGSTTGHLMKYLGRKKALISFDFEVKQLSAKDSAMSAARWMEEVNRIQDKVGRDMAESARKTMAKWLSPGNSRRIGVSGGASKNLVSKRVYAQTSDTGGSVVWYVMEGNATKANRFIRQGTKAHPDKSKTARRNAAQNRKRRSRPRTGEYSSLLHKLAEWAKAKGIGPRQPAPILRSKRPLRPDRGIGPGPLTRVNVAQQRFRDNNRMIWAMWHSMQKRGTAMSYKERFGGKKYFDYPRIYALGEGRNLRSAFETRYARGDDDHARLRDATYSFLRTAFTTRKRNAFGKRQTSKFFG